MNQHKLNSVIEAKINGGTGEDFPAMTSPHPLLHLQVAAGTILWGSSGVQNKLWDFWMVARTDAVFVMPLGIWDVASLAVWAMTVASLLI